MSHKTIAIDLDDVLAAHVPAFIKFSNERYGTHLTVDDYSDHWSDLWKVDREEIERRALEFHTPKNVLLFEKDRTADAVLSKLAQNYRLAVVTARRSYTFEATLEWLTRYYKDIFQDVRLVPIWDEPYKKVTKTEICKEISADYLIDDLPHHCNQAMENGIQGLLFGDYSWNRSAELVSGVVRVKNWQKVAEYFGV